MLMSKAGVFNQFSALIRISGLVAMGGFIQGSRTSHPSQVSRAETCNQYFCLPIRIATLPERVQILQIEWLQFFLLLNNHVGYNYSEQNSFGSYYCGSL